MAAGQSGPAMREGEGENDDDEREPGELAERNFLELFIDEIPEKEPSPENLFQKWHDNDEAQEAKSHGDKVNRRTSGKDFGVKSVQCAGRNRAKPEERSKGEIQTHQSLGQKSDAGALESG